MANKTIFCAPVFNQARELPIFLKEFQITKLPCDTILFVDDGSTDGSAEIVRQSGFPCITIERNKGIGHAFMRAIEWALERDYEIFGAIATNGKMLPSEMHRILDPILKGEVDYVTGSRFMPDGASPNLPIFRRAAIPMVNCFVWMLTATKLTDATCGYRAFRLELLRRAKFDWRATWLFRYSFEYYLYAKILLDREIKWTEVPITMRYPPKGQPCSKIKPIIGWYHILRPWLVARVDRKGFRRIHNS